MGLLLGFGANYWVFDGWSANYQSIIDDWRSGEGALFEGSPPRPLYVKPYAEIGDAAPKII